MADAFPLGLSKAWFEHSQMAQRAWSDAAKFKGKAGGKGEPYARNLRSVMRVAMAQYYGNADWMHLLLAVGDEGINADMVDSYNFVVEHRTPGGGSATLQGPRLGERALAAAQGVPPEELPPVKGVHAHHTKSPAQLARKRARRLDKDLQQHRETMGNTRRDWEKARTLEKEAEQAWKEADKLSQASRHAYWDRNRARQNEEEDRRSMVTDVLRVYADKRNMPYDGPALGSGASGG